MDAVITWLDTTDKKYIKHRNTAFGNAKPYNVYRVGKRDELRFCLRSLYYNMSWLRNIYLVTWGQQFPEWLDKAECLKLKPPIIHIDQASLNNGKYVYGSLALEAVLYRIPGLSDLFLYANCDMFVTRKLAQSVWVDAKGVGLLQTGAIIQTFEPGVDTWQNADILSQIEIFLKLYDHPNFDFFAPTHNVSILSKRACVDIYNDATDLYNKTIGLKGREFAERITRLLFEYVAVQKGYCRISDAKFEMLTLNYESDYTNYKLGKNIALLCTNLNSKILPSDYDDYMRFMLILFPKKLPCEKFMRYENRCYYRFMSLPHNHPCANKPLLKSDGLNFFPKNRKKNLTHKLKLTKKYAKKMRKTKKAADVSGTVA